MRGVIDGQHSKEIPVFLLAKSLGELKHTLRIALLGSLKPPLVSSVSVCVYICIQIPAFFRHISPFRSLPGGGLVVYRSGTNSPFAERKS